MESESYYRRSKRYEYEESDYTPRASSQPPSYEESDYTPRASSQLPSLVKQIAKAVFWLVSFIATCLTYADSGTIKGWFSSDAQTVIPVPSPAPTPMFLPNKVTVQVRQMLYTLNDGAEQLIPNTAVTLKTETEKRGTPTISDGQGVAWFTEVPCNKKFLGITFDNGSINGYEVPMRPAVDYSPSRPDGFPCQNTPVVLEKFVVHLTAAIANQPLDIDALRYPNATQKEHNRAMGNEALILTSGDHFSQIKAYYRKRMVKIVEESNNDGKKMVALQSGNFFVTIWTSDVGNEISVVHSRFIPDMPAKRAIITIPDGPFKN